MPATAERDTERHPITFNAHSIRRILQDEKTQTRRVVKPQPPLWYGPEHVGTDSEYGSGLYWHLGQEESVRCPYGKPGDVLWVRTRHLRGDTHGDNDRIWDPGLKTVRFARGEKYDTPASKNPKERWPEEDWHWVPAHLMPKWACRLRLRVEEVRVEQLQEISFSDIVAEGVEPVPPMGGDEQQAMQATHDRFAELWNEINGEREGGAYAYDENPWVRVVEFSRVSTE